MKETTRRRFLKFLGAAYGSAALSLKAFSRMPDDPSGLRSNLSRDPRRPQFHLLPTHNWMNDPNGPIYFAGKYHMFFQYNPEGPIWGNMSWSHAISDDMLHWKNYPVAFTMTPGGPDAAGCFSGSMIVTTHGGKPRVNAIYTGVVKDKAHETVRNEGLRESQCLAWSEDPMLGQWTKLPHAVIPAPPKGLAITGFRDPSVWKEGENYFLTLGSGVEKVGGCVLLYSSKDLINWEYIHPLASGAWDGKYTSNPVGDGEMWECPEFFSLDGGYVLIYSSMGKVFWQSGAFDKSAMRFDAKKSGLLDVGSFYAPKTQLDAQNRRILWGWIPERRSQAEMIEAGWSGMMSLPRILNLDTDGTLRMRILPEAAALRSGTIESLNSAVILKSATGEISWDGRKESTVELLITSDSTELLHLKYSPGEHAWFVDGKKVALQSSDTPKVHAFVDGSVVEMMLSERVGFTKRFYYPGAVAPDITIRAIGTENPLRAWTISPISNDRLTTMNSLES
jgi:beta-fructofuranosidase